MKKAEKHAKRQATANNFRRQLSACRDTVQSERPQCVLSHRILAVAEPKVLLDDLGCKAYASEDEFFQKFVFQICDKKNARSNRKRFAARDVPGLAEYKGSRGIRWRLSYRKLVRDLPVKKLRVLLELVGGDSPLYRRIIGGDERNRFMSHSLI